jgi:hypothetical protein
VQAKFLARLAALQQLPFSEWKEPLFKWLGNGIGEVRFKADGVQQRPLGFRGPGGADVFTLVFPATEKGDKFIPKDALDRAAKLKAEVESDARRYSTPCWLFDDPEPNISEATSRRQ